MEKNKTKKKIKEMKAIKKTNKVTRIRSRKNIQ